jgi:NAD(P)H-hydrate epimerase
MVVAGCCGHLVVQNLTKQLDDLGVPVVREAEVPWPAGALAGSFDCVVDALFGFSFRGPMREPYAEVVRELVGETQGADGSSRFPVVSVDVPSGWHVDGGDVEGLGLQPSCLIALTAPKPCTSKLAASSEVWLGGRFVPPGVSAAYKIEAWMGLYEGSAQVARVPNDVLREATAV